MRQIPRAELLDAMKECLRELENMTLLSPDDLDIIDQKRTLQQQITELEKKGADIKGQHAGGRGSDFIFLLCDEVLLPMLSLSYQLSL